MCGVFLFIVFYGHLEFKYKDKKREQSILSSNSLILWIYVMLHLGYKNSGLKVRKKSSVPLLDHLARYFGMVTILCYKSTWHTFKQTKHDCSYMSVDLLSLTGQG